MAAALIRIDQATHSTQVTGVAGRARNDIEIAEPVTLRNADDTGVRAWRWEIVNQPDLSAPDLLSNPVATAPTFTPNAYGSYLIRLTVNEGLEGEVDTTIAAVVGLGGFRVPASDETTEANWIDPDTSKENARGWSPDMRDLVRVYDTRGNPHVSASVADGGGTQDGTIVLNMAAPFMRLLHVVANGNTTDTDIEFFADAARSITVYSTTGADAFTGPFVLDTGKALFTEAANLEDGTIYYTLTNNGANASTYDITLVVKA